MRFGRRLRSVIDAMRGLCYDRQPYVGMRGWSGRRIMGAAKNRTLEVPGEKRARDS